jgi:hypothetical protein
MGGSRGRWLLRMLLCNKRLSKRVFLTAFEYLHCMFLSCRTVLKKSLASISVCLFTVHPSLHTIRDGVRYDHGGTSFETLDTLKQSVVQLCRMRPLRQPFRCRSVDRLMPMKIQVQYNAAGQKQAGKKEKSQKCNHGRSDLFLVGLYP